MIIRTSSQAHYHQKNSHPRDFINSTFIKLYITFYFIYKNSKIVFKIPSKRDFYGEGKPCKLCVIYGKNDFNKKLTVIINSKKFYISKFNCKFKLFDQLCQIFE